MPTKKARVIAGKKRKREPLPETIIETDSTDEEKAACVPAAKKVKKWTNKVRVLVFCSRGVSYRARHLMNDLRILMPQSKADTKLDKKDQLPVINEVCDLKNCNKCIYFEMKKREDLYMWISSVPDGPSAKFLVENIHTMSELKLTGNCLKGSRPMVCFDQMFDKTSHYQLLKELLLQSKPFIDHVFQFNIADNRIWFRNYQISEEGESLIEIGPRFVLNLIKIFGGSFGGPVLYENPHYVSPNVYRQLLRSKSSYAYKHKVASKRELKQRREAREIIEDPLEGVFD
ncbi:ribosome biogenesis protein BRX1 homolog isoform X2 [Dysidea avara]|uniref:ribosome biogenesis protein BRX1 homolog isoform X2 n=1 Tax=Dysidea avara TaxID=196820 RepID=UPI003319421D